MDLALRAVSGSEALGRALLYTPLRLGGDDAATAAASAAAAASSGRARCRPCRAVIAKGKTRLEVCASVRPGRRAATPAGLWLSASRV